MSHSFILHKHVIIKTQNKEDEVRYRELYKIEDHSRFKLLSVCDGPQIIANGLKIYYVDGEIVTETEYFSFLQKQSINAWK